MPISKHIFPKVYKENQELNELLDQCFYDRDQFKNRFEQVSKCIDLANQLIDKKKTILSIKETKLGEWIVVYEEQRNMGIYVKSTYSIISHKENLYLDFSFDERERRIKIEDIQASEDNCNRCFGSFAMEELIKKAYSLYVREIWGKISHVDWNHIERIKRFYKKHGFSINLNEETQSGSIWKTLI